MTDNSFLNKILLLLDKTKDALIEDLKKEFVSVRIALDENAYNEEDFSLTNDFENKVNIIDAVFAKVGYDISHYNQLDELKQLVFSMLKTVEGLTRDAQQLSESCKNDNKLDGEEVSQFLESAMPHIKTLLTLVKTIVNIQWNSVAEELYGAGSEMGENFKDQFLNKEFARKVLDHILITLLKNAKNVFHDEIECIRLAVVDKVEDLDESLAERIQNSTNQVEDEVKTLLKETLDEYDDIKRRLVNEMDKMKEFIKKTAGDDIVNSNIYVKLTNAMSITYSILDFLGVVREVKVTLHLPSGIQKIISDAEGFVSKANSELDNMEKTLQVTKDLTGLSAAAVGTMQTQLLTLYGNGNEIGDGINSILNNLSEKLNSTEANVHEGIGKACKKINENLETIKNISYPMTIVTVSWSSVESLFTQPISHFKNLYPINNVDDVESLMQRIMGILHCINPDIPDFDSIRNMLESLLKRLQAKVIVLVNKAKDKAQEIWEKFRPIIATIRKVIDMLREMAVALKEKMNDVLTDVKTEMSEVMNGAKQLITDLQEFIKKQAGIYLNEAGKLVDEHGKLISNAEKTLQGKLNEVLKDIDKVNINLEGTQSGTNNTEKLTDEVQKWVEAQRNLITKINIPRIVNKTIAEPLINCASGIIQDALDLPKTPDFKSAYNLLQDIASLPTLLNQQFVLEPITVNSNDLKMEFQFSEVANIVYGNNFKTALDDINNKVVKNVNLKIFDTEVENIVVPQLQAWAYGVMASIKTIVDPNEWQKRMDTLIKQLQAEFKNDLQNITSLISKDGVNRLISDAGAVKDQLKNNLQINDYVTIVQTAMNDIVLPNPELYFNSLKITLTNIVAQLAAKLIGTFETLQSELSGNISKITDIASNLLNALKDEQEKAVKEALKQYVKATDWEEKLVQEAWKRFEVVRNAVMDIAKRIQELVKSVEDFIKLTINNNLQSIADHLKDSLKNRLEDLALEIWSNLKSEVITPVLTTIKDEIIRRIRELVKEALNNIIDALTKVGKVDNVLEKLPGIKDLKNAINTLVTKVETGISKDNNIQKALQDIEIEGFDPKKPKITDLKQLPVIFERLRLEKAKQNGVIQELPEDFQLQLKLSKTTFDIPADYICWAQSLLQATIDFMQSDMAAVDILNLVIAVYKGIPEKVKDDISDLMPELPELPDNSFTQLLKKVTCNYDLDNKFCNVTLLNLETKEGENKASLLMQIFVFVGTYNPEEANAEVKVTVKGDDKKDGNDKKDGDDSATKEDKSKPALYFMFFMKGNFGLKITTENHEFLFNAAGSIGESFGNNEDDKKDGDKEGKKDGKKDGDGNNQPTNGSLGFCLTKKTDDDPCYFHSWATTSSLSGMLDATFQRKKEIDGKPNPAKLLNTKYLDLNIGNYPQHAYLLYNYDYPQYVTPLLDKEDKDKDKNEEGENKKEEGDNNNIVKANGFTFGYMAELEDVEIILKLRQNEFFKSILKDDISAKFTVSLLYDYQKGFKFGGGYSFHLDYDCSNLKLGKLQLQNLGIDIGSLKNDWGTLQLGVGSSFSINLDAVAFSFEDLGVNMNLNVVKPDFSLGDWDFGCKFKFPTGVGISIDATAVKGSGLISYEEATGELIGALELKVIDKFGVSAFMLVDLGTVEGHFFSFVGLISTEFTPGIPLGMGFSLTGIGGCLGLERMIDRKAITTAVRQGTMASIFFVKDIENHLAEMKTTALTLFPAKKNQFFLGLLGQISYEPVLTCNFGLMLQLPDPTEVIIVGSLKVALEDLDIIRINVQFAGGINFKEGLWFDASIVDSEIVGIKLEGDMAFRLFWGGDTKGFLLSVGGFHPNYKPEPGMLVSDMKRLAMKLDYDILTIGLETYLAVTSNSFQIGAHLDLKIGLNEFGIFGYAGFDALFQFDPFMFMFDAECGVSVKCGSCTLLSIDLAFSLSGPRPWHVSGSAKFSLLLIPVEVDFNLEWGDKKQTELPNKQIEVLPIFKEQLRNLNNWTVETAQTDDDVVVNLKHEKNELLVQPFGTLYFNQSAIPLQLEQPMDLCNNAVPTDYNNLIITGFSLSGTGFKKDDDDNLTNDFAPALYYNLSNQEKLSRPSYEKYVSGFSLSATETNKEGYPRTKIVKAVFYKKDQKEPIEGCTFDTDSNASMANRTLAKKDGKPQHKGPNHPLKTKKAFDRYIKTLDSINENN